LRPFGRVPRAFFILARMLESMKRLLILAFLVLAIGSSGGFAQGLQFGVRLGLGVPDLVGVWARVELSKSLELRVLATGMPLIIVNVGILEVDLILKAGNGFYLGGGGGVLVLSSASALFGFSPDQVVVSGFTDFTFGYKVPVSRNAAFYVEARPTLLFNSPLPWFVFVGLGVDFKF
jgi:hypothetical protein